MVLGTDFERLGLWDRVPGLGIKRLHVSRRGEFCMCLRF